MELGEKDALLTLQGSWGRRSIWLLGGGGGGGSNGFLGWFVSMVNGVKMVEVSALYSQGFQFVRSLLHSFTLIGVRRKEKVV